MLFGELTRSVGESPEATSLLLFQFWIAQSFLQASLVKKSEVAKAFVAFVILGSSAGTFGDTERTFL